MSVDSHITDSATSHRAKVTTYGQLVTAPLAFSQPATNSMAVDDQVYNFIVPKNGI